GPWKKPCQTLSAAPSSSATTAGSSTALPRTFSPSKATATSTGAKATSKRTRPSAKNASAKAQTNPSASAIKNYSTANQPDYPPLSYRRGLPRASLTHQGACSPMSVVRVGTTKKYADNWDNIFGGNGRTTTKKKSAKLSSKRKPAKKKKAVRKK